MSDIIERLKKAVKETLTPSEYEEWERAIQEMPPVEMEGYYAKMGCNDQPCLIDAFFRHQATLPPSQRSNSCMISCPCARCSPHML